MKYKKVLFLDTTLHKKSATGITISNLFGAWPKESLYMIGSHDMVQLAEDEGYKNVYSLSENDFAHRFPVGPILKTVKMILKRKSQNMNSETHASSKIAIEPRTNKKKSLTKAITTIFQFFGFHHMFFRQVISNELRAWINKTDPDYFYALLSTRHSIVFTENITKEFSKPLIIHIMDDWPATIGKDTFIPKTWNRKINAEFTSLLKLTEKKIAISQLMAEEYQTRFGGNWLYFHNPVNINFWSNGKIRAHNNKLFTILYSGRIGKGITETLQIVASCVDDLAKKGNDLCFKIQSNVEPNWIRNYKTTVFSYYIEYEELPNLFSSVDLLLLPYEFHGKGFEFIRLSMPTKVTEYMASSAAILLVAPKNTAVVDYATKSKWGYAITDNSKESIMKGIRILIYDKDLREQLGIKAFKLAQHHHEINQVQQNFLACFSCKF